MFFQIFRFGYERQENCVRNEGVCAFLNKMLIFYYSMCCWSLFVSVDKHVGKHFQRSHLSCIVNQFDRSAWKLSIIFPKSLDMPCRYIAKCRSAWLEISIRTFTGKPLKSNSTRVSARLNPSTTNASRHTDFSHLICIANHWTGCYIMGKIGCSWVKILNTFQTVFTIYNIFTIVHRKC